MLKFGEKLLYLRTHRNITLKELASTLGYTAHGYISEIEAGKKKPTAEFVLKVAIFFNVTTDNLLKDELDIPLDPAIALRDETFAGPLPFVQRSPTRSEMERFRLILSTFQDGTGQWYEKKTGLTLPGWRDFERTIAAVFRGQAQESKAVFDVLLPDPDKPTLAYGLSCKMRKTLGAVDKGGRATLELSNAAGDFWNNLANQGINQDNYKHQPDRVGALLVQLVGSWHNKVGQEQGGRIDLTKSCYLVLQWDQRSGFYQIYQFPLQLPLPSTLHWEAHGKRVIGKDQLGILFEWYGESGGQLKYYPPVEKAIWQSDRFRLETLPVGREAGVWRRASEYFPQQWAQTFARCDESPENHGELWVSS